MKIMRIFSHTGTKISQDPFHAESENMQNMSLSLSLHQGLVLETLPESGVFFSVRRQQATGKSLLSVCLPFQGQLCVFFI